MRFERGSAVAGGRYELISQLGVGGMATVWKARDTVLDRIVALKIPAETMAGDAAFIHRFEREAQISAGLSHPNLVSVYDYGVEDERPYLVMEHIDGENLAERKDRHGPIETVVVAAALLGALENIHRAGIVHRDVKPANLLVDQGGRLLLTDFGIAQSDGATHLTGTGQVIGTLSYLAPELMDGERASPRSDLYSAGVLLRDLMRDDDPPELRRLVESLLQEDPLERPSSAASALATISRLPGAGGSGVLLDDRTDPTQTIETNRAPARDPEPTPRSTSSVLPPPPPLPPPPAPRTAATSSSGGPSRSPLLLLAGLLLVAGVVLAVVLLSSGGGDSGGNGGSRQASASSKADKKDESTTATTSTTTTTESTAAESTTAESTTPSPADTPLVADDPEQGSALNDQGYSLLQSGDPESALPLFQEAMGYYPADSTDVEYAYLLFNYAQALRQTGDPEAAIPLLERRLSFSDDRPGLVRDELALAEQDAGQ